MLPRIGVALLACGLVSIPGCGGRVGDESSLMMEGESSPDDGVEGSVVNRGETNTRAGQTDAPGSTPLEPQTEEALLPESMTPTDSEPGRMCEVDQPEITLSFGDDTYSLDSVTGVTVSCRGNIEVDLVACDAAEVCLSLHAGPGGLRATITGATIDADADEIQSDPAEWHVLADTRPLEWLDRCPPEESSPSKQWVELDFEGDALLADAGSSVDVSFYVEAYLPARICLF